MLVTVYITTRNRIALVKRAIESVKNQDYENIELIVCDDGSTDGTPFFLKNQQKLGALKCILHESRKGACTARNSAIELATGEFITGLDDDDWFKVDRVTKFVEFWNSLPVREKDNTAGLYSNSIEYYKDRELIKTRDLEIDYSQLRINNGIGNQIFAPKINYQSVNSFDPAMPAWQDWDCWVRMAKKKGIFKNCLANTYAQDASHDSDRITEKSPELIRDAYQLFLSKLGSTRLSEKIQLNRKYVDYRQIVPSFYETFLSLFSGDIRLFISCGYRLVKNRLSK